MSDYLYHYTDFRGLDGILSSRSLYLGNLRHMNDASELECFIDNMQKRLLSDYPTQQSFITNMFDRQRRIFANKTMYAFSLSELEDDVGQWDRYANKGSGVCIKFKKATLNEVIKGQDVFLNQIYYGDISTNHKITALIDVYLIEGTIGEQFESIDQVFENAWSCSPTNKNGTFASEREYRICCYSFPEKFYKGTYVYKPSERSIREFMPVSINNDTIKLTDVITEIKIGPKAEVDVGLLKRYLINKHGIDSIIVSKSNSSLR